ncbi:unnamed protein product [Sympodiomycopsis kandeliae]
MPDTMPDSNTDSHHTHTHTRPRWGPHLALAEAKADNDKRNQQKSSPIEISIRGRGAVRQVEEGELDDNATTASTTASTWTGHQIKRRDVDDNKRFQLDRRGSSSGKERFGNEDRGSSSVKDRFGNTDRDRRDRDYEFGRDRDIDRRDRDSGRRDPDRRDSDRRDRESDRDSDRDRDRDRHRRDRHRDRERRSSRDEGRIREQDRNRERDRERDREREMDLRDPPSSSSSSSSTLHRREGSYNRPADYDRHRERDRERDRYSRMSSSSRHGDDQDHPRMSRNHNDNEEHPRLPSSSRLDDKQSSSTSRADTEEYTRVPLRRPPFPSDAEPIIGERRPLERYKRSLTDSRREREESPPRKLRRLPDVALKSDKDKERVADDITRDAKDGLTNDGLNKDGLTKDGLTKESVSGSSSEKKDNLQSSLQTQDNQSISNKKDDEPPLTIHSSSSQEARQEPSSASASTSVADQEMLDAGSVDNIKSEDGHAANGHSKSKVQGDDPKGSRIDDPKVGAVDQNAVLTQQRSVKEEDQKVVPPHEPTTNGQKKVAQIDDKQSQKPIVSQTQKPTEDDKPQVIGSQSQSPAAPPPECPPPDEPPAPPPPTDTSSAPALPTQSSFSSSYPSSSARRKAIRSRLKPLKDRQFIGCSEPSAYQKVDDSQGGLLGMGTFGEVSRAKHLASQEEVALKKIKIQANESQSGMPITAIREIKLLKKLSHPNVCPTVDMVYEPPPISAPLQSSGTFYMVLPYMEHDLNGLIERLSVEDKPFSPAQIKLYMKQLFEGTLYLHQNKILHRDIKAANILISNSGNLKIADFGLARPYHDPGDLQGRPAWKMDSKGQPGWQGGEVNYTGMVVTRWYRPPELLAGERKYGPAVDMWGLGCLLAEMIVRRPIFKGSSEINQLEQIVDLCGSPNEDVYPGWSTLPGVRNLDNSGQTQLDKNEKGRHDFGHFSRRVRERFMGMVRSELADLIDRLLILDPRKRLTAQGALSHKWFDVEPLPADPKSLPVYPDSKEANKGQHHQSQPQLQPQPQMGQAGGLSRPPMMNPMMAAGQGPQQQYHGRMNGGNPSAAAQAPAMRMGMSTLPGGMSMPMNVVNGGMNGGMPRPMPMQQMHMGMQMGMNMGQRHSHNHRGMPNRPPLPHGGAYGGRGASQGGYQQQQQQSGNPYMRR